MKALINFIIGVLKSLKSGNISLTMSPPTMYSVDRPRIRQDRFLTPRTTLYQLTITNNSKLQVENRKLTDAQIEKLIFLARHRDDIGTVCSGECIVHSGYRCEELNGNTPGASSTSQHPRCEGLDFHVVGQPVIDTFAKLIAAGRAGKFRFGQLIIERANRGYKNPDGTECIASWVHCSTIGTLDPSKVGQVMKANWNPDTKRFYYEMIDKLKFLDATIKI